MCVRTLRTLYPATNAVPLLQPNPICKRCHSQQIILDRGEKVCNQCGLVYGVSYDVEFYCTRFTSNSPSYRRIFYFNERCSRWLACEPIIHPDIWGLIAKEANDKIKYGNLKKTCNRKQISQILRSVNIPEEMQFKHRSKKFKMQLLTKKRFYDKYFEKWKTIRWKLTGIKPITPSHQLVAKVKDLFQASQIPFDTLRHKEICDGRGDCEKYYGCEHNFTNYDYAIRWYLQICDLMHGFESSYNDFKYEFPLVSKRVIKKKLRPMMTNISTWNNWPVPQYD